MTPGPLVRTEMWMQEQPSPNYPLISSNPTWFPVEPEPCELEALWLVPTATGNSVFQSYF